MTYLDHHHEIMHLMFAFEEATTVGERRRIKKEIDRVGKLGLAVRAAEWAAIEAAAVGRTDVPAWHHADDEPGWNPTTRSYDAVAA